MSKNVSNSPLNKSRVSNHDEFYTLIKDIEKELSHYGEHFENKTIYCNCDNPYESNFAKYFVIHFNEFKLKKLIITGYNCENNRTAYKAVVTKVNIDECSIDDISSVYNNPCNEIFEINSGDFRSKECQNFLKEADIIVTNPPFSLYREYVDNLIYRKKKFIILGNMNAITYKNIFSYISSNIIWCGYGFNMTTIFKTPYVNTNSINKDMVSFYGYNPDDGYIKVSGVTWFTNLEVSKRKNTIEFQKRYSPADYYKYDNFDAIDVPKVKEIPLDYTGIMGVPVTFINIYNPNEFEIIGSGKGSAARLIGVKKNYRGRYDLSYTDELGNKHCPFGRILIRKKIDV